jgi:PAS domain S-box-containing protein
MSEPVSFRLEPDARNVSMARRQLRGAMSEQRAEAHVDAALLALSEIVTNAFVHTGDQIVVVVWADGEGTRVEVRDTSPHMPVRRHYADAAGTGRGLKIVEEVTDRWGTRHHGTGKTVWFEIGRVNGDHGESGEQGGSADRRPRDETSCQVTLRRVPLLMHWAWQEHAATLLREYLLYLLDEDDTILDRHAEASEAMSLLHEQVPAPELPDDPDGLMAGALEPHVTADEVVLNIPLASVAHFATLDDLLTRATQEARADRLLGPPIQPEMEEMRQWICTEVAKQTGGQVMATPWLPRTDVRATLADQALLMATYAALGEAQGPLLATDEASIIVAASQAALHMLGYELAEDLLGRRILVVVPPRYHQAHIAGTTLNATNGRDTLLGVPLVVPMIRADGSEIPVSVEVRPERLDTGHRVFVARFAEATRSAAG